eukprot:TCONS_00058161-protein
MIRSSVISRKSKRSQKTRKPMEDVLSQYADLIQLNENEVYRLENKCEDLVDFSKLDEKCRRQQYPIFEFIKTEKKFIQKIHAICKLFCQIFKCLKNDGYLANFQFEDVFANIEDVFRVNDRIWATSIYTMLEKTRHTKAPIKPSEIFQSFIYMDDQFQPYLKYSMKFEGCVEKIRQVTKNPKQADEEFTTYLQFCDRKVSKLSICEGMKIRDLMSDPLSRMMKYPDLLQRVRKYTQEEDEIRFLDLIISKIKGFLRNMNTEKRRRQENVELQSFVLQELDDQDVWFAGTEEIFWSAKEFLRAPMKVRTRNHKNTVKEEQQRCLLKRGPMRISLENRRKLDVEAILFSDVLIIARNRRTNKKLTLVKQLYFLDKVLLKLSEVSSNGVLLIYKNEVGLLSEVVKLEIWDYNGEVNTRDIWCNKVEIAKRVYLSTLNGTGSTLDIFQQCYNKADEHKRKEKENEGLENFKRTSSWLLVGDRVEALRKSRNKQRSISTDSFKRALSDPNLLEGLDQLPEEEGESPRNGEITPEPPQIIIVPEEKKFLSLRLKKSASKMTVIKKFSLDNSPKSTFFVPEEEDFEEVPRRRSKSFDPPSERAEQSADTTSQDSHDTAL